MLMVFFFSVSYLGIPLRLELCSASGGAKCVCEAGCCSGNATADRDGAVLTGVQCCAFLQAVDGRHDEFVTTKTATTETSRVGDVMPVFAAAAILEAHSAWKDPHPVARSGVLDIDIPLLVSSLRI
jgi:hypothetical protein